MSHKRSGHNQPTNQATNNEEEEEMLYQVRVVVHRLFRGKEHEVVLREQPRTRVDNAALHVDNLGVARGHQRDSAVLNLGPQRDVLGVVIGCSPNDCGFLEGEMEREM